MGKLTGKKVVIIHGWSDHWKSMQKVGKPLGREGATVYYVNYDSREDKAVYEDFAEGLQRELMARKLIPGPEKSLNFVTHSTGALVLRQWFRQYPDSQRHSGNVVFLAPANFGSPLAAMGKSLIGKIFKGQHRINEDAFEVGENILHGLELASPYAWGLAQHDILGSKGCIYHKDGIRASVITGHKGYGGLRRFVNKPGTDGTIVVAGANLNVRKLILSFVRSEPKNYSWWYGFRVKNENPIPGKVPPSLPFAIHNDLTHASILELARHGVLREQVADCLRADPRTYDNVRTRFADFTHRQVGADPEMQYQQLVFHVRDDRGMPVKDYHLEFNVWHASRLRESYPGGPRHVPHGVEMSVREEEVSGQLDELLERNLHTHSQDSSYKRYLIHPDKVKDVVGKDYVITMRINAKSGDKDIRYLTNALANVLLYHPGLRVKVYPFLANTTTLVEIRIDRESDLLDVRRG